MIKYHARDIGKVPAGNTAVDSRPTLRRRFADSPPISSMKKGMASLNGDFNSVFRSSAAVCCCEGSWSLLTAREQSPAREFLSVLVLRNKPVPIGFPCQQTQFVPLVEKGHIGFLFKIEGFFFFAISPAVSVVGSQADCSATSGHWLRLSLCLRADFLIAIQYCIFHSSDKLGCVTRQLSVNYVNSVLW